MTLTVGKSDLNRALPLYVGVGFGSWPKRDFARVVEALGTRRAAAVEAELGAILEELYANEPDWSRHSLIEAGAHAVAAVQARRLDLDKEAGEALFWDYSWNYK